VMLVLIVVKMDIKLEIVLKVLLVVNQNAISVDFLVI